MQSIDISVVIGSYNQSNQLEKVIHGYIDQSVSISFEVIIVDSFSTDGTAQMITQFDLNQLPFKLSFIQRDNPAGKAEARNHGVQSANSDLIIISDADMIPAPGFVQTHYDAHQASHSECCFEGLAYNLETYDWPPTQPLKQTQVPLKYKNKSRLDWYYFLTGNISFSRSIFLELGGFSHDFKNYGWEDLELGYRFKQQRIPLYYLTDAVNYHYHVISPQEKADRKFLMGQSAQIFIAKHPELKRFLGWNPLSIFLRKQLSKTHSIYRVIAGLKNSKRPTLQSFSYWFLGEYNYLSGLLNLDNN